MNRSFSIYLDLVRIVSALMVVIYHANIRLLSTDKLPLSTHGHAAVIVFFVLSGYVIAHITAARENTPQAYWSSRLARFYSLALPVVLLTPVLDLLGEAMAPQFYQDRTTHDLAWLRILTSLAFLNEVWTLSIMSFSNVPYWSLCYEFWYYVLFAILTFMRGRRRLLWTGAVTLLVGPKILLLAPAWACGVVLYRWRALQRIPPMAGALLFAASCAAYGLFHHYDLTEVGSAWLRSLIGAHWHQQLAFSRYFITDYLLALIVAANFIGMRAMAAPLERLATLAGPLVKPLAGYSFSIYLLHQPLIQFYAALLNGDPSGPGFLVLTMLAVLGTIFAIGKVTEQQRHHWRRALHALLARPTPQALPAVVLGIDTPIGLAIIRDLGRHGVQVYGIARSNGAVGLGSRYLHRGMLRADDVLAQLRQLGREIGPAALYAIAETDIIMLNKALLPGYLPMFPDAARMQRVLRKDLTYAAARAAGVFVPRTWQPANIRQAARAAMQARYPVVLKWADPNAMQPLLRQAGMALEKIQYCHDAPSLMACLRRYQKLARYPLVQEYCAGYGLGQFVLMKDGQALYQFQHRRLHEWPPQGGASTLCVSETAAKDLMRQSIALLQSLEWEGVAMVEYRYDPATGQAALMEVNGRFWGSLPLACQAGAHFPWYVYQAFGLQQALAAKPYRAGVRCRFMTAETRRLWALLTWRELAGYVSEFLRPRSGYFVHDWRDPLPLWRDLRHSVLQRLTYRSP